MVAATMGACERDAASSPNPTQPPPPPAVTATPEPPDLTVFRSFIYPIGGACLPQSDLLMPNAPRPYRNGVHEGIDLYPADNCTGIQKGTPVLAAKDGTVIRTDIDYHDLTQQELADANGRIAAGGADDPEVLNLFRGRQVWIDHGAGIVTRYAHLEGVAADIREGTRVAQGTVVGYAGDSGTPESLSAPDTEIHLHWELRTGDTFLGAGLPPDEVRALYLQLFEPAAP